MMMCVASVSNFCSSLPSQPQFPAVTIPAALSNHSVGFESEETGEEQYKKNCCNTDTGLLTAFLHKKREKQACLVALKLNHIFTRI